MEVSITNPKFTIKSSAGDVITREQLIDGAGIQLSQDGIDCRKLIDFGRFNQIDVTENTTIDLPWRIATNKERTKFFDVPKPLELTIAVADDRDNDNAADQLTDEEINQINQQAAAEDAAAQQPQQSSAPSTEEKSSPTTPHQHKQMQLSVLKAQMVPLIDNKAEVHLPAFSIKLNNFEDHLRFAILPITGKGDGIRPLSTESLDVCGTSSVNEDGSQFNWQPDEDHPLNLLKHLDKDQLKIISGFLYILYGIPHPERVTPEVDEFGEVTNPTEDKNAVQRRPRGIDDDSHYNVKAMTIAFNESKVPRTLEQQVQKIRQAIVKHFQGSGYEGRLNIMVLHNALAAAIELFGPNADINSINDILDDISGKSLAKRLAANRQLQGFFTNYYFADIQLYQKTRFLRDKVLEVVSAADDLDDEFAVFEQQQKQAAQQSEQTPTVAANSATATSAANHQEKAVTPTAKATDKPSPAVNVDEIPPLQAEQPMESPAPTAAPNPNPAPQPQKQATTDNSVAAEQQGEVTQTNFARGSFSTPDELLASLATAKPSQRPTPQPQPTRRAVPPEQSAKPAFGSRPAVEPRVTVASGPCAVIDSCFELLQKNETLGAESTASSVQPNKKEMVAETSSHKVRNFIIGAVTAVVACGAIIFGLHSWTVHSEREIAPQVEQVQKQQNEVAQILNHQRITNSDIKELNSLLRANEKAIEALPDKNYVQHHEKSKLVNNYNNLVKTETNKVSKQKN